MVMQNKNFEDFMGFRDMIQGNSLNDRMEMVDYMSTNSRALGGPTGMQEQQMMQAQQMMPAQEQVEPLAKRGDSLAELYAEAILTKNPDFFNKFYKKETKLNQVANNTKTMLNPQMGLTSMPMVQAGFGGFLKDIGLNVGKAFLGDVIGAGIGSVADSFSSGSGSAIGNFFDSSAGRGLTAASTNAAVDYAASEFLGEGEGPNIESFLFDAGVGAFGDYYNRPKEERDFFGLSSDSDDEKKQLEILLGKASLGPATDKARAALDNFEGVKQRRSDRVARNRNTGPDKMNFLQKAGVYGGVLDKGGKFSGEGSLKRAILPVGSALVSEAERQSATPVDPNQGQGVGRPSKFIPDLNRRATRRQPKRARDSITSEQARQLKTRGFFIDTKTGQRVTSQDLIGGVSYLPSTQAAKAGGLVNLQEGGQPNPTLQAYQKWLANIGGAKNLDKAGLRQGRIDMAYDEEGPIHFANPYPEGDGSAGLYSGFDNYWAYPEHPDFKNTIGRVFGGSNIMFDPNTGRALAPEIESGKNPLIVDSEDDPDNLKFIMSLLFPERRARYGGLVNRASGGDFSGMIGGDGHGMEDNVQMPIVDNGEQVATLAVSPKEYVVDAYTMAALGNGNPDEGAKIMDQTIKGIRQRAYGTRRQPNEINGTKALQSGLTSLG
jgi:hypothetical protein